MALFFFSLNTSYASPFNLSYSGRLTQDDGMGLEGSVNLTARFYHEKSGGTLVHEVIFNETLLKDGHFHLKINIDDKDRNKMVQQDKPLWIEITDQTNKKTYPRQKFSVIPYAIKTPVDNKSIIYNDKGELEIGPFSEVTFDSDATTNFKLKTKPSLTNNIVMTLPRNNGANGEYLSTDEKGNLSWKTPPGAGDMTKINYDKDSNGKVDKVTQCDTLEGKPIHFFWNIMNHVQGDPTAPDSRIIFQQADQDSIQDCIPLTAGKVSSEKISDEILRSADLDGVNQTASTIKSEIEGSGSNSEPVYQPKNAVLDELQKLSHTFGVLKFLAYEGSKWTFKTPDEIKTTILGLGDAAQYDAEDNAPGQLLSIEKPSSSNSGKAMEKMDGGKLKNIGVSNFEGNVPRSMLNIGEEGDRGDQLIEKLTGNEIPSLSGENLSDLDTSQLIKINGSSGTIPSRFLDTGKGSNKIVQIEANDTLPSLDGSQLTNLNPTEIKTGHISNDRLDVGTGPNKVLRLDSSGKFPAVDGSLLTNISADQITTGILSNTYLKTAQNPPSASGFERRAIVQLDDQGKLPAVSANKLKNLNGQQVKAGNTTKIAITRFKTGENAYDLVATTGAPVSLPARDGRNLKNMTTSQFTAGTIDVALLNATEDMIPNTLVKEDSNSWSKARDVTTENAESAGGLKQLTAGSFYHKGKKTLTITAASQCNIIDIKNTSVIHIKGDSDCDIKAFQNGKVGQVLYLINGTSQSINLLNNSGSSSGKDLKLPDGSDEILSSRGAWKLILSGEASGDWTVTGSF